MPPKKTLPKPSSSRSPTPTSTPASASTSSSSSTSTSTIYTTITPATDLPPLPPPITEKLLQQVRLQRLALKETVFLSHSLQSVAVSYTKVLNLVNLYEKGKVKLATGDGGGGDGGSSSVDLEDIKLHLNTAFTNLAQSMTLYTLDLTRLHSLSSNATQNIKYYTAQVDKFNVASRGEREEIGMLVERNEERERVRREVLECEGLGRVLLVDSSSSSSSSTSDEKNNTKTNAIDLKTLKTPMSTTSLLSEISVLKGEIDDILQNQKSLQKEIEAKERAFQGVLGGILECRRIIGEEGGEVEKEEGRKRAEKGGRGAKRVKR